MQIAPVEIVSICDPDRRMREEAAKLFSERMKKEIKPRLYGDYRELLKEKDIDVCMVETPDHWHALPMIAACEAGADVWVQKPVSVDVMEGKAMVDAARKHNRVVQVVTQRRSTPHLIEARDRVIKEGKAWQDRPRRNLLLLSHAVQRRSARDSRSRNNSITRCGPVRRRFGRTTRRRIRTPGTCRFRTVVGGERLWNTATAS